MTKPKPTPYDTAIKVVNGLEIDPPYTGHHTIEITGSYDPGDGGYTFSEVVEGWRWCTSMFARLAVRLADDVYALRRDHGWCTGQDHCGVTLLEATAPWHYPPALAIELPSDLAWEVVEEWRDRAITILSEIVEADLWQPTPEDEDAWCT